MLFCVQWIILLFQPLFQICLRFEFVTELAMICPTKPCKDCQTRSHITDCCVQIHPCSDKHCASAFNVRTDCVCHYILCLLQQSFCCSDLVFDAVRDCRTKTVEQ